MDILFDFIQQNVAYAPVVIFFLLFLAGFNLPISEDAMLFVAGVLASQHPEQTIPLFLGVFLGAYVSDIIVYWLGRILGERVYDLPLVGRFINHDRIDKVKLFYIRYGIITLMVGRFIPFGVRNALFMTAGLARMNHLVFLVVDFFTVLISCSIYFTLYYRYGEEVIQVTKQFGIVIFSVLIVLLVVYVANHTLQKGQQNNS
jgi:membrane-associated protein